MVITVTKWMIFIFWGLEATTDDSLTVEELIRMTMRTGEMALAVMKKLDEANTTIYGNPYPHKVDVTIKKRSVYHCFRARLKRP